MSENPFSQLTFKELHLFPRALFLLGLLALIEGMIRKDRFDVDFGMIFFFGSIGINILYDLKRGKSDEMQRIKTERIWMWGFCMAAFVLTALAIWLGVYFMNHPE